MSDILLANLTLENPIGSGYFGTVYEGVDPIHGRVAVKVFSKRPDESEAEWNARKARLLHEGKRLKDAEHPNVVRVLGIFEADDDRIVCLVMEKCDNGSLQGLFERGPASLTQLRKLLTETALGLQAIHSRGMIHRDIKPSNILIDETNHAKLADFGLVTDNVVFGYASAQGYVDHLAKEVFETGLTSVRTDIWAFGMTVYRLLHGQVFYSELPRPRPLIEAGGFATKLPWLPHIPDAWRRFIRQAMHDDPHRRIQSATEILQKLESLPIEPDWQCAYSANEVSWIRTRGQRRIEVRWTRHSARRQEWVAKSYPIGSGRDRKLAGSGGMISKNQALRALKDFLTTPKH